MVQKKIKTIIWSDQAARHYHDIMEYLSEESPEALPIVGNALLDLIESLATAYDHHPPDRFKKRNNGTYKAAVVFSYRVSYLVTDKEVYILRVRHTSREPLGY